MRTRAIRPGRLVRLGSALGLSVTVLTACGFGNSITVHQRGRIGVTVDETGRPVLAVLTCRKATPQVDLAEGRHDTDPPDRPNVQRGNWQARASFTGVQMLPLASAGPNWEQTGPRTGQLEPDRLFVAGGGTTEDDDAVLQQVTFRGRDLAGLDPGRVRVGEGTVQSMDQFRAYRCADD